MSVGFWMMKPELVFLGGRAEAGWLAKHMEDPTNTESSTQVDINEDSIKSAVKSARYSERLARKEKRTTIKLDYEEVPLEEHIQITKKLSKELREMLKRCKKETDHEFFDLVVSW